MPRDPKSDVLQLQLSRFHSLDVVRLPNSRKYRVVFAERFGVQRRAFVEISFDEAARLALFLANIEDSIRLEDEPPTNPGKPSTMPPTEVDGMLKDYLDREAQPLPPIPELPLTARTRSKNIVPDDDHPEREFQDPRTGVIPDEFLDGTKDD